jgi:tetratricopeptide (TPR) repeat protein
MPGNDKQSPSIGRTLSRSRKLSRRGKLSPGGKLSPYGKLSRCAIAALLSASIVAGGCQSAQSQQSLAAVDLYYSGDAPGAVQTLAPLATKTDENFVLNNVRLGAAAISLYDLVQAETAFLRAYEVINSVGVNNGGRSLGAAVISENIKVWKGEPFERAMVNYYLGLVYYMEHDYNNARAAFENALFKLRDYGTDDDKSGNYNDVESNFTLAYIMLGRCYQRLGNADKAHDMFAKAVQLQPNLSEVADYQTNEDSNVLLVVDFGRGPEKYANTDGVLIGFVPTPEQAGPIPMPQVYMDGGTISMRDRNIPTIDLLALAQDRRWEDIDTIRAIKAAVGLGLVGVGAYEAARSNNTGNQIAGLAMIGAGLLINASARADTRQWGMLPRTVFLIPLRLQPGVHDLTVAFPGGWGLSQTWRGIVAPAQGEATYYFRMLRDDPQQVRDWPPPTLTPPSLAPAPARPANAPAAAAQ